MTQPPLDNLNDLVNQKFKANFYCFVVILRPFYIAFMVKDSIT